MVSVESLVIQESLENMEDQDILVDQETVALKDHLVKMVPMETDIIALSVLECMQKKENLVLQEDQESVDPLDL